MKEYTGCQPRSMDNYTTCPQCWCRFDGEPTAAFVTEVERLRAEAATMRRRAETAAKAEREAVVALVKEEHAKALRYDTSGVGSTEALLRRLGVAP